MPSDQGQQIIIEQLNTILILLERPIVRRQLFALALVILVAWLLSRLLYRGETRYLLPHLEKESESYDWSRWLPALQHLYFPLLASFLLWLPSLFDFSTQTIGLLLQGQALFWIWSAYGIIMTAFSVSFGESQLERYEKRLFFPLFLWLIGAYLIDNIIDLNLLAQIQLLILMDTPITLGAFLLALLILYLFVASTWVMQDMLLNIVMPRISADPGVMHSILAISHYLIIGLGIVVALSMLGFNLSTLALIGGGLSIGIGFGLQQIIANFISGILLLFEQALRPGDMITIDGQTGTVEKFSIRSTLVRTYDNQNLIIPNENLLTSVVTSYSKTNNFIQLLLPVGVGYDSSPPEVRQILLNTALKHQFVQEEPEPNVFFLGFGDSSLDFELAVWISESRQIKQIRSDLYFMIWDALAEHQIEIPFPQRDLNLRRGWEQLSKAAPQ